MDVAGFEDIGVDAVPGGGAAHPGERSLDGFLHHGSELSGHDEALVPAGHAPGFDEQDVSAYGSPGKADGHSGAPRALGDFGVGPESRGTELRLDQLRRHGNLLAGTFGDAAGLFAADGSDFALQV